MIRDLIVADFLQFLNKLLLFLKLFHNMINVAIRLTCPSWPRSHHFSGNPFFLKVYKICGILDHRSILVLVG